jgi:hypothetical protein
MAQRGAAEHKWPGTQVPGKFEYEYESASADGTHTLQNLPTQ